MRRTPQRGEIWYVKLPTDPPEKAARPVIIVSLDARNRHSGSNTVLVAPLTGSVEKDFDTHIPLSPGETGLHASRIRCEDLTVVKKEFLVEPKFPLRTLSNSRVCEIADKVRMAMGCAAK
ncbi:MAG: type II toxin-antitoxin system PemK/MazF family toxin [Terriglobales bacterium]|jgi:mRNA-degrading endonuclease toxin of MazEF toxin-antitoxin module